MSACAGKVIKRGVSLRRLLILLPFLTPSLSSLLCANSPSNTCISDVFPLNAAVKGWSIYSYYGGTDAVITGNGFLIDYPDSIDSGNLSGSDVVSFHNFTANFFHFDACFNFTVSNATYGVSSNEMAVFVTNNTATYKGLEFGLIACPEDGSINGYVQEGIGSEPVANFQTVKLLDNDRAIHRYGIDIGSEPLVHFQTVKLLDNDRAIHRYGIGVNETSGDWTFTWWLDSVKAASINFDSWVGSDYLMARYRVVACVHRTTADWDDLGSSLFVGNFDAHSLEDFAVADGIW